MTRVRFLVNGISREISVDPEETLLRVLRSKMGLTGTKEGCGRGVCGSCVVLVNRKAVRSCRIKARDLEGADIVTVEGLGDIDHLHPLQKAFVRHGAVQCGYCTPGMLMEMVAFLEKYPSPTRKQIQEGIRGHLCRCTGYHQIVEAALEAAREIAGELNQEEIREETGSIGASPAKRDAWDKVTGKALYTADLPLPKSLWAKAVRSQRAHAKILSIDTKRARAVPGVLDVFTSEHIPGENAFGKALRDQPVLCGEKVRFMGDPVALVVAETEEAAREGASQVHVEYEDLPAFFSSEEALAGKTEPIHESGNIASTYAWQTGDVEEILAKAPIVVENVYKTHRVEHALLETEAALAYWEDDVLRVVGPTQNVFFDRREIAHVLGIEKERVRVIQPVVGASFGKREDLFGQILCALAAFHLKRPVRMNCSREESFACSTKRHPFTMWIKTAALEDGSLLGQDVRILADTGAYASWAPNIIRKAASLATGPYFIPHVRVTATAVYTNQMPSGAMRGYGAPQVAFACESQIDEIAWRLGVNPLKLRRKNALREGMKNSAGQIMTSSVGLLRTLEEAERAAGPEPKRGMGRYLRGRGMSSILYGIGYGHGIPDMGSAVAELNEQGELVLRVGCVDYGQGAQSVLTQIAGEVLGVSPDLVCFVVPDTHTTPDSGSTVASRQTYVSGNAVKMAFERLREGMLKALSAAWNVPVESIRFSLKGAGVYETESEVRSREATWIQIRGFMEEWEQKTSRQARFRAMSTPIRQGEGQPYWPYAFATHIADVCVDTQTGKVIVERIIAAHDVGRALHPQNVRGQIVGGVAMGLGFALTEEFLVDSGVAKTLNFDTYRILRSVDMPEVVAILVEEQEPTGPFGAKGVGEPPTVAVAPAVANAIRDALGIRVTELPVTPERILAWIRSESRQE